MMTYIEYKNKIAFHPGYYINQYVEESGLSQEEFAKRLGTTPKNLSVLINAEQSVSLDLATKLSKLLNTSVEYWLNLQQAYDLIMCEINEEEEYEKEKNVFKLINYEYFTKNFNLPLNVNIKDKIKKIREFLKISSLTLLLKKDITVDFRSYKVDLSDRNIVNANIMMQIAINEAIHTDLPSYNKLKFNKAIEYALSLTTSKENFLLPIKEAFYDAGVLLIALPNIQGSGINGGTKKINGKRVIMINDRRHYIDTLWFTLFHEIGHVKSDDYTFVFDNKEELADEYALNSLIPNDLYYSFVKRNEFNVTAIRNFSKLINRDPGIVLGRLMADGYVSYNNTFLQKLLRRQCNIKY